jgi:hypothetical protein
MIRSPNAEVEVRIRVAGYPAKAHYCELVGDCPPERHPSLSNSDDRERAWSAAQEARPGDLLAASERVCPDFG